MYYMYPTLEGKLMGKLVNYTSPLISGRRRRGGDEGGVDGRRAECECGTRTCAVRPCVFGVCVVMLM